MAETLGADDTLRPPPTWWRSAPPGRRVLVWIAGAALVLGGVAFVATRVLGASYQAASGAMAPTIEPGTWVWAMDVDGPDVGRGDIVVFGDLGQQRILRAVAVGGDVIGEVDGQVTIDGEPIDEPYLPPGTETDGLDEMTVPEGHVFLLGDNRLQAADSRLDGPSDADGVSERVVAIGVPAPRTQLLLLGGLALLFGLSLWWAHRATRPRRPRPTRGDPWAEDS